MRNLVGIMTWILLPVAVVIVAFKYAMSFVEELIKY